MKKQAYEIIMRYFNTEHIDRVVLEKSLDFENLTIWQKSFRMSADKRK